MGPKEKGQNKASGRKKKRKNISPLCPTQQSVYTDKTGSDNSVTHKDSTTTTQPDIEVSKRVKYQNSSPEHFIYDTTALEIAKSMSQNMSQNASYAQAPYTVQYTQSPPGSYTTMMPPTPHPQATAQPPPWALSIIEELKTIRSSVNVVEKTVSSMSVQLSDMNTKIENIDKRVIEVETSCKFISDQYEHHSSELKAAKETISTLEKACSTLNQKLENMSLSQETLHDRVLDGEFRNMRNNLIFYGIPEQAGNENCEELAKTFTTNELNLDCANMIIDRAHRLGHPSARKPRPIIVRFNHYQDREKVLTASTAVRDQLKRNNQGVGVQIPREWREARKQLYPTMKAEKDKGHYVKFIGDKLFVNGQQYRPQPANT